MTRLIKRCWTCRSTDLEFTPNIAKCRACGATWNPLAPTVFNPSEHTEGQKATRRLSEVARRKLPKRSRHEGQSASTKQTA